MPYIIAFVIIIVIGISYAVFKNPNTEKETLNNAITKTEEMTVEEKAPTTESVATEPAPEPAAEIYDYTDGSYTTSVTYFTPMQSEYLLDVTLKIENDIVVDAGIVYSQGAEKDPNAQRFEAAYEAVVIGKDIDSLNLSRVGGASLTTGAFNKALAKIKLDAGA